MGAGTQTERRQGAETQGEGASRGVLVFLVGEMGDGDTDWEETDSGRQGAETQGEGASGSFCFLVGGMVGVWGGRGGTETEWRQEAEQIQGEGASRVFLFSF